MNNQVLIKNSAECALCHDVIESKHRHDFVHCKCGEIFIDGGTSYVRCGANDLSNIINRCEYREMTYQEVLAERDRLVEYMESYNAPYHKDSLAALELLIEKANNV